VQYLAAQHLLHLTTAATGVAAAAAAAKQLSRAVDKQCSEHKQWLA
jgi:hypothetical protein